MKKIVVGIDGMACAMCEAHINEAIRNAFSVKKVTANRKKKEAVIISEEDIAEEAIKQVIDPTGYTMTSYTSEEYKRHGLFG